MYAQPPSLPLTEKSRSMIFLSIKKIIILFCQSNIFFQALLNIFWEHHLPKWTILQLDQFCPNVCRTVIEGLSYSLFLNIYLHIFLKTIQQNKQNGRNIILITPKTKGVALLLGIMNFNLKDNTMIFRNMQSGCFVQV